jgi:hypothetical protein
VTFKDLLIFACSLTGKSPQELFDESQKPLVLDLSKCPKVKEERPREEK